MRTGGRLGQGTHSQTATAGHQASRHTQRVRLRGCTRYATPHWLQGRGAGRGAGTALHIGPTPHLALGVSPHRVQEAASMRTVSVPPVGAVPQGIRPQGRLVQQLLVAMVEVHCVHHLLLQTAPSSTPSGRCMSDCSQPPPPHTTHTPSLCCSGVEDTRPVSPSTPAASRNQAIESQVMPQAVGHQGPRTHHALADLPHRAAHHAASAKGCERNAPAGKGPRAWWRGHCKQ